MFVHQHNRKPILLLFLYFSFLFSSYSAASDCPNQPITYAQVTDEQLLIISLRLNGIPILDDMSVYQVDEQLLLPVSILTDVLKLPIKLNKSTISGNLLAQQCEFNWPLLKKSNTAKKNPWRWGNDEFDDYIDAKLLNTMLGSNYEFSYSLQQLSLKTTLNLDILEQLKAANIRRTKRIIVPADLIINDQYNTINYPVISYNLNNNYQSANKSNSTNLQLNGFFDFLNQSAELRVNTNKSTTNQYLKIAKKFTFSDENSTNNAVSYQFGDIQSQRDNLIHTANLGAGFYITNANPYYNNSFSTITIEESVLAGWRAELYRNGQFIAESSAGDDNRMVFNNIDTFRGLNLFSIKLFGPEGQQITRYKKIMVGNRQLTKNNWNYQFEYIDRNARFIDHNIANPNNNGLSAKALLSYGLSDDITFTTGSHFIRENNNDKVYLSSSIDGNIYDQGFTIQVAKDLAQGEALFAGLSGDISSQTKYKINYNLLNDFTSAIYRSTSNQIKSQLNIKLNGYHTYANWRATLRNQQQKSGLSQNFLDLSLNKNLMNSTFSSSLLFNDQSSLNTSINRLFWSYYAQPWNFSTSVDWLPFDQGKIQGVNSEIRWPQYRKIYNQTRLQYNPSQKASYNISHNLTFRHKNFNFQLIGQVDNQGDWQLSAGISGTLGYNNTTNKFMFLQPQALNSGLIEAQVFFG